MSGTANAVGPCSFVLTSQTNSRLQDKALASSLCVFRHFIKTLCRHRCRERSGRQQSAVTQQTGRVVRRGIFSSSPLKRRQEMRFSSGERVSEERSNSSALREQP